jgi:hypothetical protein
MRSANRADPFYEAISAVRDALQGLLDESVDLESDTLPSADSPAMREISLQSEFVGEWGEEPVEHAHVLGVWKRALAVDCAQAMTRDLHEDPAPVFAYKVLSRAVIENAASAAWLLEPGIGIRLRIARGRNERLYSARQVLRLDGLPEELRMHSEEIVERIMRVGGQLGFSIVGNEWLEEHRPRFTARLRWMLGDDIGSIVANYYSAVAHGTQYGLASALMSVDSRASFGMRRAAIGLSSTDVNLALAISGLGLIRASSYERRLMGRDTPEWRAVCSAAAETFRAAMIPATGSEEEKPRSTTQE